jgi:hypothetical protein
MDASLTIGLWALLIIGGPLVLAIAFAFGIVGSRQTRQSPAAKEVRERGARRVYEADERERRQREDD